MGTRQHKAHSQKTDSRAPRGRRPGSRPFSRPRCPAPRHRVHSPLPAVLCLTQTIPRGRHLFQEAVPKSRQHLTSNLSHSRSLSTPSPLCVSSPSLFHSFFPPKTHTSLCRCFPSLWVVTGRSLFWTSLLPIVPKQPPPWSLRSFPPWPLNLTKQVDQISSHQVRWYLFFSHGVV